METNEQTETLDKKRVTAYLPIELWGRFVRHLANLRVLGELTTSETTDSGYIVEAIRQRMDREKTNGG